METICRFELCSLAADIISNELSTPNFTDNQIHSTDYNKARYLYVYFCHTSINASFRLIRKTLLCYEYPKTVYQVFSRSYKKRKGQEFAFYCSIFKSELDKQMKDYKGHQVTYPTIGRQMKLFDGNR